VSGRYWIETLGCPKNQVDSEKLSGALHDEGFTVARSPQDADLVVVNTCAFIEAAREESVHAVLAMADARGRGARLVVTGCMAERYGDELAELLPEVDLVAGFGVPVTLSGRAAARAAVPAMDLLNLPRPRPAAPWAYVKVAEGCDRRCGFCAIPSFRGPQRSRSVRSILDEVEAIEVAEVVLVAQDLASYGKDDPLLGVGSIVPLVRAVAGRVTRTRLLYLYPSDLTDSLVDAVGETGVPYFDLSLQHASRQLLRRMRRWGDGDRFLRRIGQIRRRWPQAAFRSNFVVGYPGETEEDHDELLGFLRAADLDWAGFFAYSREEGTYAAGLDAEVPAPLVMERLAEASEVQEVITSRRRQGLIGEKVEVLVDGPGVGRTHREAPEIDGIVKVPDWLPVGELATVVVTGTEGPDLYAEAA
jgi:ribosomal protein S12 methylthiotransferase